MDNKKLLIILGVIIGLIIVGLILFLVLYPKETKESATTLFGIFPSPGEKITVQPSAEGPIAAPPTIETGQRKPLFQLTQKAVSAATFAKNGMVRYFEKATGNIYDINPQGGISVRISNTTIPNIFEVCWSADGERAVIRYTENNETGVSDIIRNFSIVSIDATSTSINGVFLPSTVQTAACSAKENKIFYLTAFEDTYIGITASFENKKQKQVLTIPFGEFQAGWPNERTLALLTKPAASVAGYLYKLDPISGSLERILYGINGLTGLWSGDGAYILYSDSESGYNNLKTNVYSVKEKKTLPFGVTTLPEKCAWSKISKGIIYCAAPSSLPSAKYPDDWYQGLISFSDQIWKIDVLKGETEIIPIAGEFDIINPFFSKNEDYFFFQNKKDGTLWSLRLQ
jgi:hypothetical protein